MFVSLPVALGEEGLWHGRRDGGPGGTWGTRWGQMDRGTRWGQELPGCPQAVGVDAGQCVCLKHLYREDQVTREAPRIS